MNATNRIVNRALLLVAALVLGTLGLVVLVEALRPPWATDVRDGVTGLLTAALRWADGWRIGVAGADPVPATIPIVLVTALGLLVLLFAFVLTRGGGRTSTVIEARGDDGSTAVDHGVVDAILAGPFRERPDVLSARTRVYRVGRAPAIRLDVTVRRGADLGRIVTAAEEAVAWWDTLADVRIPVLLHLSDRSWRDRLRAAVRVR